MPVIDGRTSELKQFPSILCGHGTSGAFNQHQVEQHTVFPAPLNEDGGPQNKQDFADAAAVRGSCFAPDLPTNNLNS